MSAKLKTLAKLMGSAGAAAALTTLVATWEGEERDPYKDIVGVWTVCFGDTHNVTPGKRASKAECSERLERQLIAHGQPVLVCTPSLKDRPHALTAAISLAYNIGTHAYCKSTVARRFNAGDWNGACDAFLMWNRAGGKVVRGLVNRRKAERKICLEGIK